MKYIYISSLILLFLSSSCQEEKTTVLKKKELPVEEKAVEEHTLSPKEEPKELEIDYQKLLKGKFILKGADYAGFNFISKTSISWTNELFPMDPDHFRLRWLNKTIFFATDIGSQKTDCPPLVWMYEVISFDGTTLVMNEISTSWNYLKDEKQVFIKEVE